MEVISNVSVKFEQEALDEAAGDYLAGLKRVFKLKHLFAHLQQGIRKRHAAPDVRHSAEVCKCYL